MAEPQEYRQNPELEDELTGIFRPAAADPAFVRRLEDNLERQAKEFSSDQRIISSDRVGILQFKSLVWIAAILILAAGLVWGINNLLPDEPQAGGPALSSSQEATEAVHSAPGQATAPTTSASPATHNTPPAFIGPNMDHQTIRQRLLEPRWETLWVESQSLEYEPDGQIMVTHSQAWLDRDGGGRVIRTDPQPYAPVSSYFDLTPYQVLVSDGQDVDLFDLKSDQLIAQDAGRSWIMHPLEENLGLLFPSHLALRSEDVQVGQVSEQAGRTALMVRWANYQLWVDVETGVILREQVSDPNGGLLSEQIIGDIVYNPAIPRYIFSRDQIDRARFEPAPTAGFELPTGSRSEILTHTVQAGENLFSIADQFQIEPESLLWSNVHLLQDNPQNLEPGMELLIPPRDGIVYRWQAGDDLIKLAIGFGVSPADILNWPGNANIASSGEGGRLPEIPAGSWVFIPGGQRVIQEPDRDMQQSDVLQDYPLTVGTSWVYRYDEYQPAPQDATRTISAISILTETVIDGQSSGKTYLVQVETSRKFVDRDQEWVEQGDEDSIPWYVIAGGRIYGSALPLVTLPPDTADLKLLYDLPLFDGQSWCPYEAESSSTDPDAMQYCSGRSTVQAIGRLDTPAGVFEDCYEIVERYNNGSIIKRYCNGVGLVSAHFDHTGSKFGYHKELQAFIPGAP
jgi:hypothetical protein